MQCIFCKIINGEIPSNKIYEDDNILVIQDIQPAAPSHVLVLPKQHAKNILEVDNEILSYMTSKIPMLAEKLGLTEKGFRVVVNTGDEGGQTVEHLHFHILGGRELQWPPG